MIFMEKKMKIMAVGDIHGDTDLAKKLAKRAIEEKVDLVILPGDITWLDQEFEGIIEPFTKTKKEILLLPGNHEPNSTINFLSEFYPKTKNLHGDFFKKRNIGFFGAGYHPYSGPFFKEEDEIFKALQKGHEKVKDSKIKVMVTHGHHKGSKAEFSGIPGSSAIKKAIKKFKPDFLISGHIHEAGGLYEKLGKTKVLNVARKAAIFEI